MTISLGKQYLRLPEPLCLDHQLLRVQQGREVIVGPALRGRSGSPARPTPGRARWRSPVWSSTWSSRGTRSWSTSTPARGPPSSPTWSRRGPLPAGPAPAPRRHRPGPAAGARRGAAGRARSSSSSTRSDDESDAPSQTPPEGRLPGDLVVRTTPDLDLRHGMHGASAKKQRPRRPSDWVCRWSP